MKLLCTPHSPFCLVPFTVFECHGSLLLFLARGAPSRLLNALMCVEQFGNLWKKKTTNQEQLLTCTLHVSSLCRALPPVHGGLLKAGLVEKCFSVLSFGRAGCRATRFSHHLTLEVRHSESNKEG